MSKAWINDHLQDWAEWRARASGYATTTTIHRMIREGHLSLGGTFTSQIPKGAEDSAQGHVRRLNLAMNLVREDGFGREVNMVIDHYMLGWKNACEKTKLKKSQFFALKKKGVDLLRYKVESLR